MYHEEIEILESDYLIKLDLHLSVILAKNCWKCSELIFLNFTMEENNV